MVNHSAKQREETSHVITSTRTTNSFNDTHGPNNTFSDALKRRARSLIIDRSIDAETRAIIRYGLEINDPSLPELIRRVDAGQSLIDETDLARTSDDCDDDSLEEKIEALTEMICRAAFEPTIKSGALFVLMAILENSHHSKALANLAKHLAFTRCGELNLFGMVDAHFAIVEGELFSETCES